VVQSKHKECVGICQEAFLYRQRIPSLIDALKDCYRMTRGLTGDLLKTER
jgi:hypothetical protein